MWNIRCEAQWGTSTLVWLWSDCQIHINPRAVGLCLHTYYDWFPDISGIFELPKILKLFFCWSCDNDSQLESNDACIIVDQWLSLDSLSEEKKRILLRKMSSMCCDRCGCGSEEKLATLSTWCVWIHSLDVHTTTWCSIPSFHGSLPTMTLRFSLGLSQLFHNNSPTLSLSVSFCVRYLQFLHLSVCL